MVKIRFFQPHPYGKAKLALLYQPCSTPESVVKPLNRWIKECPMLVSELHSLNYNPKRRTFLRPEVDAIVRHLGEAFLKMRKRSFRNVKTFVFIHQNVNFRRLQSCSCKMAKLRFPVGTEIATCNPQLFLIVLWRACVRMRTLYI